ncbi:cytidylate kinase [Rhodothermaceae bacterium RA]|nr:cytidylate kinase [Rhodothermaceae bacterium RA]
MPSSSSALIIAIDGPAGSGKSTTARRVAERLGYLYLDTGAMYRAVALGVLEGGYEDPEAVPEAFLETLYVDAMPGEAGMRTLLNGRDVSEAIREPAVSAMASRVAVLPAVRTRLVEAQRRIARRQLDLGRGVVLDGRDIGTVVFPDADVKVFLVADLDVRARRRRQEWLDRGQPRSLAEVRAELQERDARDRSRAVAPLRQADDAVVLDTSGLSIDEQVEAVLRLVAERNLSTPVK